MYLTFAAGPSSVSRCTEQQQTVLLLRLLIFMCRLTSLLFPQDTLGLYQCAMLGVMQQAICTWLAFSVPDQQY